MENNKALNKGKKKTAFLVSMGCLAVLAASMVSVAFFSAKAAHKDKKNLPAEPSSETEQIEVQAETVQYYIDENQYRIVFDELQKEIEETIDEMKDISGGEWSVYVSVPSSGDSLSINQKKMQAASVIKLFIMGAVYEDYDGITEHYEDNDIEELIENMIIISDNDSADTLVTMLGRGDSDEGRKIVTDFCHGLGLTNTNMNRMIQEDNDTNDNYTTTEDTAKFLEMILNGEFKHSKDMLKHLQNQTRKNKIPAGVAATITTANKTGELDDVQNDAAIIFTKRPYIICVMSDGVIDYQPPIDEIVTISSETYNYLITRM